ncbi:MAG TPA: hypothetical protein VNZ26_02140 [Vicinamibacterales bacterium]|nr:hypothetical protein [Vicinamibacterales bacterium]
MSVGNLGTFAGMVATTLCLTLTGAGQTATPGPKTKKTSAQGSRATSRTPWGDPDLQGIWSNATTTPLERPSQFAGKETLSSEEADEIDRVQSQARSTDNAPKAGDPGTYNEGWWERGKLLKQTALVVDPADGRIPGLTPQAQQSADARAAATSKRGPADSWEDRNLHERCILYHGVPPLPTGYNNNYHIVQTREYVAILHEMIHEIRLIPLDGRPHVGSGIRQWMGDSRGHWEGDTLVVDTTNFNVAAGGLYELSRTNLRGTGETLHVVERFTRRGPDEIDYRFTVDDARTFSRSWSGSIPMSKIDGPIFEYACHEGNYAMTDMLKGARAEESAGAAKKSK